MRRFSRVSRDDSWRKPARDARGSNAHIFCGRRPPRAACRGWAPRGNRSWHKKASEPATQPLNLQSQLSTVWTARYQQDQVLWRKMAFVGQKAANIRIVYSDSISTRPYSWSLEMTHKVDETRKPRNEHDCGTQ